MKLKKFNKKQSRLSAFLLFVSIVRSVKNSQRKLTIMKNLPLFVTLGIVTLMGACNAVNSETPTSEDITNDSSIVIESSEETSTEGLNIELESSTLEAQAEEELPLVDGATEDALEDVTIGAEEDVEIEAIEINPDVDSDVILPATDNADIPTAEEAAEVVEPAE